jgi:hypothetical protein
VAHGWLHRCGSGCQFSLGAQGLAPRYAYVHVCAAVRTVQRLCFLPCSVLCESVLSVGVMCCRGRESGTLLGPPAPSGHRPRSLPAALVHDATCLRVASSAARHASSALVPLPRAGQGDVQGDVQGEGEGDPPGTTSAWMSVAAIAEVGAAAQRGAVFLRTFLSNLGAEAADTRVCQPLASRYARPGLCNLLRFFLSGPAGQCAAPPGPAAARPAVLCLGCIHVPSRWQHPSGRPAAVCPHRRRSGHRPLARAPRPVRRLGCSPQ